MTNKPLESNHPDMIFVHKIRHKLILIGVAVPSDRNIVKVEQARKQGYHDMAG